MYSLFMLIAFYTIASKQAVPSGDVPVGATYEYAQSGTKSGQMTAGNDLTLILNGFDGMILQSVTLSMHSNSSAGAGELQLKMGDSELWSISDAAFSSSDWAGAYGSDWVDISHTFNNIAVPKGAPISLHIAASKNSLYLQSVAVEYMAPQSEMFTVKFNTYSSERISPLKETMPNSGVVVPNAETGDNVWNFYGWALRPTDETEDIPSVYTPGTTFYPSANCILHAIYKQQGEQLPWYPTDELKSGDYLIVLNEPEISTLWIATGAVDNGMLAAKQMTYYASDDWLALPHGLGAAESVYTLGVTNDTLTIKHKASKTAVLLATTGKFAKSSSANNAWVVTPCESGDDEMPMFVISGTASGKLYYISYYLGNEGDFYFRPTTEATQQHNLLLFALDDRVETSSRYTSFAFGSALPTNRTTPNQAYKLNMGLYTLTIQNGHKSLQIHE